MSLVRFLALYTYGEALGLCSGDCESEEDDEEMDVDAAKQTDEIAYALEVADALGRTSSSAKLATSFDDVTNGLKELDMENYDEEDDGIPSAFPHSFIFIFSLMLKCQNIDLCWP